MIKGKFIVLYGSNNLGKSNKARLLVENLHNYGLKAEYLKYPIYNIEPTGPKLNEILRGGTKQSISEIELQQLYVQNRTDYQPELEKKLDKGINIIAEDYIGTGLAWGVTKGANLSDLEQQNKDLLKEDLVILLDGERYIEAKEDNHIHEQNDELMIKNRQVHLDLAKKYGWQTIEANAKIPQIAAAIWQIVDQVIDTNHT